MPPYSPAVIANELLARSGRDGKPITPMQLQKLVYLAHGWNLGVTGTPLVDEGIEAWKYGPVIPSLFHTFKQFGGSAITKLAYEPIPFDSGESFPELDLEFDAPFLPDGDKTPAELIDWIWSEYGSQSGWQLSMLTHQPNTPWSETIKSQPAVANPVIDNDLIRRHYLQLWTRRNAG